MRIRLAILAGLMAAILTLLVFPIHVTYAGGSCNYPSGEFMQARIECGVTQSTELVWAGLLRWKEPAKNLADVDILAHRQDVVRALASALGVGLFLFFMVWKGWSWTRRLPWRRIRWLVVAGVAAALLLVLPLRQNYTAKSCTVIEKGVFEVDCSGVQTVWIPLFHGVHDENAETPFYTTDILRNVLGISAFVLLCYLVFRRYDAVSGRVS